MELRQLRHFVAVAEEGNISRAAQKIFLTQPALSRQIKALEEEIGLCLLERSAHAVRLTPVGETLLREARDFLRQADSLLERVRAAGRGPRLRVGYAPSLAAGFLPLAMESFTQRHPDSRVELFDLSSAEILADLEHGKLDVAVTVGDGDKNRSLRWTPLVRAPWRLAVPRQHPLAKRARVTPAEVAKETLAGYRRRDYPEYREMIEAWLRGHRHRPRWGGEYDGAESLMAAVEAGLGVALVTTRTARRCPARVRLKPLADPPPPLCIAAGFRRERAADPPLMTFIEEMRRAAPRVA